MFENIIVETNTMNHTSEIQLFSDYHVDKLPIESYHMIDQQYSELKFQSPFHPDDFILPLFNIFYEFDSPVTSNISYMVDMNGDLEHDFKIIKLKNKQLKRLQKLGRITKKHMRETIYCLRLTHSDLRLGNLLDRFNTCRNPPLTPKCPNTGRTWMNVFPKSLEGKFFNSLNKCQNYMTNACQKRSCTKEEFKKISNKFAHLERLLSKCEKKCHGKWFTTDQLRELFEVEESLLNTEFLNESDSDT